MVKLVFEMGCAYYHLTTYVGWLRQTNQVTRLERMPNSVICFQTILISRTVHKQDVAFYLEFS